MPVRRLGAYVLPGDTDWLAKSLGRYYPLLSELVVVVPRDSRGWTGVMIPVAEALAVITSIDHRSIMRVVEGEWIDAADPMRAETAQRRRAIDELRGSVDWVLQIDNDEWMPDLEILETALDVAEARGAVALEWPMRVLYRRTSSAVYEVVAADGNPVYDFPGPIAIRPEATLVYSRRVEGEFLRAHVMGDHRSLQLRRQPEPGEHRWSGLKHDQAIIHNSWARSPVDIRRKLRSWGHTGDARFGLYYWLRWWPTPLTWRLQRNIHPLSSALWPRLARRPLSAELVD
ncbi:MAG TPA: hypothetical protein VGC18_12140 [Lacisediminihabitans sp.]|uniref:hypothetical protein n=1 Tax=Lacisediminihabitans sp. TaxID=2787631 RepID=UPI002ED7DA77